jgi:tetratricopeptide (TPR) repeat protein
MRILFSILIPIPVLVPWALVVFLTSFASWRFDPWLRPSAALRLSLFAVCLILVIGRLSLALGEETAVGYFRKALETIRRGAFREAEVHVKAGLKLDPNSPAGHDLLGIAYDNLGRFQEAEQAFQEALRLNPKFVAAHNDWGRSLYRRGMVEAASEQFKQVLHIDPKNFTSNFNLGLIARDAGRHQEAAKYLEIAHQVAPSDPPTLLALTEAYLGATEKDRALGTAEQLVSLNPKDPQIRFSLGILFQKWKHYPEAAEHLESARMAETRNFELLYNLGQAYNHLKKYSEAEDALLQALSVRSNSVETMYQLALVYVQSEHPDQAIQVLVRARQLAPKRPDVLLLLGRECIHEGFLDDAIEVLQECVRMDPDKLEPHLLLGEAFTRKKRFPDALKEYETVVKFEPSNPQSYLLLGRTLRYMGQQPDAERVLRQALQLDPTHAAASYYLGVVASDQMDYQEAEGWFAQSIKLDPNYLAALYDMGVNCLRLNDDRRARDYFERARAVDPKFAQVYYRLSVVYRRLKDVERATEAFTLFKKYEQLEAERRKYFPSGVLEFVQETQNLPQREQLDRYRQELLRTEQMKPDDLNVLFMLAQVYFRLGQKEEGLQKLERISSLFSDNAPVCLRTASLLTAFKCYPEGRKQLEGLLEKHPGSYETRFALASLDYTMQRYSEALKVLATPPVNAQDSAAYHNLLGRILIREGEVPKALGELQQSVALEPSNEEFLLDLVLESALVGELRKARHALEKARVKVPASGRIRFAEGICYQLSGHGAEALEAFRQSAELSWKWEVPYLAQGNLFHQMRSVNEALEVLDQTVALFPSSPWPHWLTALTLMKSGNTNSQSRATFELKQSLELGTNQPEVYRPLLVTLLQRDDCEGVREVWGRMVPLGLTKDLDPNPWCGAATSRAASRTSPPDKVLKEHSELRVLVDLARAGVTVLK